MKNITYISILSSISYKDKATVQQVIPKLALLILASQHTVTVGGVEDTARKLATGANDPFFSYCVTAWTSFSYLSMLGIAFLGYLMKHHYSSSHAPPSVPSFIK